MNNKKGRLGIVGTIAAAIVGLAGALIYGAINNEPPSITINRDGVAPNMTRPTQLHIQNVTKEECDGMGGKYDARVVLCKNVDY